MVGLWRKRLPGSPWDRHAGWVTGATDDGPRFGGLLRERNFRLLLTGETISGLGNSMAVIGVPLLAVSELHAGTFAVAALTAAAYFPWLVIGLPAGAWVDRLPLRRLMIVCDLISVGLFASVPLAAWAGVLGVGQLLVVEAGAGATGIFFGAAYQAYLPVLVRKQDLMEGNAKLQGSGSAASISGSALAGLAAEAVGYAAALLFNAASFAVSAVCLLAIKAESPAYSRDVRHTTIRADIAEGLRFVWRDRLLLRLTIFPAVANLAYGGSFSIMVVFLVRVAHFGSATVGVLMAMSGAGSLIGALTARRLARALGTARAALLNVAVGGLAGLMIPLTAAGPRVVFYVAGTGIVSATIVGNNIIMASFRQTYAPPAMLGRVVASQRFVAYGSAPLGALLAGGLATAIAVRPALWIMLTLFALAGALLLTRPLLANRDLPAARAEPVIGAASGAG
jgi:predicted MFS family arabinose efflux permease